MEQDIDIINTRDVLDVLDKYYNLLVPDAVSLLDYFTSQNVVYIDEITKCRLRSKGVIEEQVESQKIMTEKCQIYPQYVCSNYSLEDLEQEKFNLSLIYVERINQDRILHAKRKEYSFNCREVNFFRSSMDLCIKEIQQAKSNGKTVVILTGNKNNEKQMKELINQKIGLTQGMPILDVDLDFVQNQINVHIVPEGYLTDNDLNNIVERFNANFLKKKKLDIYLIYHINLKN